MGYIFAAARMDHGCVDGIPHPHERRNTTWNLKNLYLLVLVFAVSPSSLFTFVTIVAIILKFLVLFTFKYVESGAE